MSIQTFDYIQPADAIGPEFTPERTNYLDVYDFSTYDIPHLREQIIEKYNPTITGFLEKFSNKEQLTSEKYIWSEKEHPAITYDDATLTVSGGDATLARAASAKVLYRLHEKVRVHTSIGAGTFIVTDVAANEQSVTLGTYDADSITLEGAYSSQLTGVYVYSLGIEVGKGSSGDDFTKGLKLPYKLLSNRPAITREIYTELGSVPPQVKWVKINGQPRWFISEVDETRRKFFESIQKKLVNGTIPASGSDAESLGLQGTQGFFEAVKERGGNWEGLIETVADLEAIIKHWDKVQAAGVNLVLGDRDQELAFDTLGRTFNSSYGDTSVLDNHIGEYMNAQGGKVLKLGFKGFEHGGYTILKQGWKYLQENTFLGNSAIAEADRIHFMIVPIGMTPVSEGDANLQTNPRIHQRNYLTQMYLRDFVYGVNGSLSGNGFANNGDDKFKVDFLNESMLAVFNAEKFMLGIGTQS